MGNEAGPEVFGGCRVDCVVRSEPGDREKLARPSRDRMEWNPQRAKVADERLPLIENRRFACHWSRKLHVPPLASPVTGRMAPHVPRERSFDQFGFQQLVVGKRGATRPYRFEERNVGVMRRCVGDETLSEALARLELPFATLVSEDAKLLI